MIPDDLTIPQFILDHSHPLRPNRPVDLPWLVVDKTSRRLGLQEIQARTNAVALILREKYGFGENDVLTIVSTNHVDYLTCMWAVHRLLGILAPCNPALTSSEIIQHLQLSKTSHIIVHQDVLDAVIPAARQLAIGEDRIVVLTDQDAPQFKSKAASDLKLPSVEELIQDGKKLMSRSVSLPETKLASGEAKTRIAFYSSSSGTTGPPKMVKISHYGFIADVVLTAALNKLNEGYSGPQENQKYRPGDSCLAVLPFYREPLMSHFNIFAAIAVVIAPKFNFNEMLRSIERHRISSLMVVPPQVVLLCKDPAVRSFDLSSIHTILCAAAPLPGELYDQLLKLLPHISIGQAYGSTEATGVVSMTLATQKIGRHGGILLPGIQGRVVKADGTLAAHNEPGELHIKSPAVSLGYLDNDAATNETFLEGGWLRMGDQVIIDEGGEIIVLDRIKEMIKVRGFQVAPAELEGCILDHPYAGDACVVGIPDPYNGELPLAFVVLTEKGQAAFRKEGKESVKAAIQKHVERNKARFKHLHGIEIIDTIPKTPSGKLLRRVLRDRALQSVGGMDAKL